MKPYASLTVHGQALRLRRLALTALQQYPLEVAHLRLISNDFNGIFRVDTRDGQKLILRVTLPESGHTHDHLVAEMDWLAALARDTDLSLPRPLPSRDGSLVVEAQAEGVPQPRLCEIFSWVPGKDLAENMHTDNIAKLGELMAQLHLHAGTYQPPNPLSLLQFDRPFPFPEPVVMFEERFTALFPPARRSIFEQAIAWTQESINRLQASGEAMRILHNDLHQWNVRVFRGKLSPIDFEDLMLGWPVQDIATTLYYFPADNYAALRTAFQEGYTRRCPWPERHPGEIDSFVAARGFGLANFILNDPNPAWRSRAGEFIERVEKQLRGLMFQQANSYPLRD